MTNFYFALTNHRNIVGSCLSSDRLTQQPLNSTSPNPSPISDHKLGKFYSVLWWSEEMPDLRPRTEKTDKCYRRNISAIFEFSVKLRI